MLLVEDNLVNQKVASRMLELLGCEVELADNGLAAVTALAAGDHDLVFMDCQMPELDGFEATIRIRAREATAGTRVPIVAMTAGAMVGDREHCLAVGMDDYIAKPISKDQVEAALGRWLPARRNAATP